MSPARFTIEPLSSFRSDIRRASKKLYRKDSHGRGKFEALIAGVLVALSVDPYARDYEDGLKCEGEAYPAGYALTGCILRKAKFELPKLRGGSALARIPFEVDRASELVRILAFYTHQDYSANYPKPKLVARLKEGR